MLKYTYWNNNGTYQSAIEELNELIPIEGTVASPRKNKKLEKLRKAANCYHDLYNNGLGNRAQEFREVFGIASSKFSYTKPVFVGRSMYRDKRFTQELYELVEKQMDRIVGEAAFEQGIDLLYISRPKEEEE